jgi:RNA polymerase primary sigma factor
MPTSADDLGFIDRYMQAIGNVPLLTAEEETELADKIQTGDKAARDKMLLANLRLVVKIAYDYANMGVPLIDLISEGNLGLIKSVERFDPRRGGRLATYAAWWIRQTIKKALADQGKMMRLPMHMVEKIAKLRRATADLTATLHREPTVQELAKATHFSQKRIHQLKDLLNSALSLETPVPFAQSTTTLEETLGDEQTNSPLATLLQKTNRERLNEVLSHLDPRQAAIMRLRYGIGEAPGDNSGSPKTLDEIGQILGLTRERVRQLELEAQTQLRRHLTSDDQPLSKEQIEKKTREKARVEVLREFMIEKGLLK